MPKISKSLVDKLISIDSKTRGAAFNTDASYIRAHYSEAHLDKVKARLKALGHPIDYDKAMNTKWYPTGLRVLSLLVIKEVLGLSDQDLIKMGDEASTLSFFIRLILRFMNDVDLLIKRAPLIWSRQVTYGSLVVERVGPRELRVKLVDSDIHDDYLFYLQGYIRRVVQFTLPKDKVKCKLVKGYAVGRNYAEYKIYW